MFKEQPQSSSESFERALQRIADDLAAEQSVSSDAHLRHVGGLLLVQLGRPAAAIEAFVGALTINPLLWESWASLVPLLRSKAAAQSDVLQRLSGVHMSFVLRDFFLAALAVRLQSADGADWQLLGGLHKKHPGFAFVAQLQAEFQYNRRHFDDAERRLEGLISDADPFHLAAYELLSNIYYIKEEGEKLALLAQKATAVDALSPETCCVVGNFYSLRNDHEKAIQYFQRALRLDTDYLCAWTLIGHEYLELKNTHAAIHSYNAAVSHNTADYRAWYGLGQTYELLKLPAYAAFYFRKAVECKPADSRMWLALAAVYEAVDERQKAIDTLRSCLRCVGEASGLAGEDPAVLLRLGKLLMKSSCSRSEAFDVLCRLVRSDLFWSAADSCDVSAVLWFLALQCYQQQKFKESYDFCLKIFDYGGNEKESATELLKELHKKLQISDSL